MALQKYMKFGFALPVWLAACAQSPESIQPSYVSPSEYSGWSCSAMRAEAGRVNDALAVASKQQSNARSGDVAGVILLGLPVSSLSGANVAPEVARLKGHKEVIERTMNQQSC
ncbi:hypothetical protein [Roseibium sp.]|uniref:hypothetical protein n=1 Tax=Roseibium sp. TaxID=1936156 RepID=UPI003BA9892B